MFIIDLHIHSLYSDGNLAMPELAALINKAGLKYCSVTDHDTVGGVSGLLKHLKGSNIVVIPGVELTALYEKQEVHILAYGFEIDKVSKILRKKQEIIMQKKIKRSEEHKTELKSQSLNSYAFFCLK